MVESALLPIEAQPVEQGAKLAIAISDQSLIGDLVDVELEQLARLFKRGEASPVKYLNC